MQVIEAKGYYLAFATVLISKKKVYMLQENKFQDIKHQLSYKISSLLFRKGS